MKAGHIKTDLYGIFCVALLSCFVLSGCGFKPLYGENRHNVEAQQYFDRVFISNIPDHEGQYLRNALMDRLYQSGRPAHYDYILDINNLRESITDLDVTKNADATRAQLRMQANMVLKHPETNSVLLERPLTAITSYNILQSQFTTRVSEENTRQNALDDLARQIETQLSLYFQRAP